MPSRALLGDWLRAALGARGRGAEIAVRVVGRAESRRLNRQWRRQDHATNVLSFPAPQLPARRLGAVRPAVRAQRGRPPRFLGDLVICAPVLEREALEQGKSRRAHWAHLVVHGGLHLIGLDHEREPAARRMERRERRVLSALGFPDPYAAPPTECR